MSYPEGRTSRGAGAAGAARIAHNVRYFHPGQVSDPPPPQLALLKDAAASLDEPQAAQEARMAAVAAPPPQAELYYDALLGPLCASLDVWRTTYTHRLPDAGAAWRCYAQASPALAGVELEANPNPEPDPNPTPDPDPDPKAWSSRRSARRPGVDSCLPSPHGPTGASWWRARTCACWRDDLRSSGYMRSTSTTTTTSSIRVGRASCGLTVHMLVLRCFRFCAGAFTGSHIYTLA